MDDRLYTEDNFPKNINSVDIIDHCICKICLDIIWIPTSINNCGHIFCKSCIEQYRKNSFECPLRCINPANMQLISNKWFETNMIGKLKYKCMEEGCKFISIVGHNYHCIIEHKQTHRLILTNGNKNRPTISNQQKNIIGAPYSSNNLQENRYINRYINQYEHELSPTNNRIFYVAVFFGILFLISLIVYWYELILNNYHYNILIITYVSVITTLVGVCMDI
jgi:hypothetical protein